MIIQHNILAMNGNRMLGITTSKQKKSAEKLSSGYRINRAADDAAGLSISEKMRRQIRGLDRASTNSMDGISLTQTAEGALAEVHDMLHRMNELAVQAANGTNSECDRDAIQAEIEQLVTEVDRVSETTKFNEEYLLKGSTGEQIMYLNIHDAGLKGIISNSTDGSGHGTFTMDRLNDSEKIMIANVTYTIGIGKADVQSIINDNGEPGDTVVIDERAYHIIEQNDDKPYKQVSAISAEITASTNNVSIDDDDYELRDGSAIAEYSSTVAGKVNSATSSVTISGSNNNNGTYTLIDGSGNVAEHANTIANKITSATTSVNIGGSNYVIKTSDGYVATANTTIANAVTSANTVTIDGTTYTLRSGGRIAGTTTEVSGYVGSASPSTVTINDGGATTIYTIGNDPLNGETSLSDVQSLISSLSANAGNTVSFGTTTYEIKSYSATTVKNDILNNQPNDTKVMINNSSSQKYLLKKNYKSNTDLKNEINSSSTGTVVKITNGSTTNGYTVQSYNYSDVKNYISSARVGAGTSATTTVSITAGGSASSYKLRNYNMQSVKALVAGYEYPEDTVKGIIIKVDGNAYTAETEFYRSKLCIAYGEDNQTNVKAEGASNDDPISSKSIVTFHGKTYTLLLDENFDGYDDDDDSIVTEGRAYKIIAKELARASSIGATESSVVVRDKHNVDIVDDVTMAADFLDDPDSDTSTVRFEIDRGVTQIAKELRLNIHAGADADMNNKVGINIKALSARGLGIEGLNVSDDNGIAATYALDAIEDAIMEVSKARSLLGAVQNRLEHTIRNLDNVVENTTAAESRIRDTDMPEEMVEFSKNNILAQAGQAMLAQANQTPQGVMALLGG